MSGRKRADVTLLLAIAHLLLLHVLQLTHHLFDISEKSLKPTAVWAYVTSHPHKVIASHQLVGASVIQLRPCRVYMYGMGGGGSCRVSIMCKWFLTSAHRCQESELLKGRKRSLTLGWEINGSLLLKIPLIACIPNFVAQIPILKRLRIEKGWIQLTA